MKKALARLGESVTHLKAIEDFFLTHDTEYAPNEEELEKLGRYYEDFSRELYPGGRKAGRHATGGRPVCGKPQLRPFDHHDDGTPLRPREGRSGL